jgi:FlaA1/EpsC-like NDP-sugar epimerase
VLGATKRLAELACQALLAGSATRLAIVRFGNVLDSAASVVPIFREQIGRGGPVTVTHPDVTRYFMTIPEAAWLILDAAALGTNGDLFVLDMGEPVRIMDLARDLVRLAGRDPDSQPIEIVGLRPGEKLHEELFYEAEEVEPTSSPKVLKALTASPPDDIRVNARRIIEMATGADEARVGAAILHLARGGDVAVEGVSVAIPPHPRPTVTRRDTTVQAGDRREPPHEVVASVPGS